MIQVIKNRKPQASVALRVPALLLDGVFAPQKLKREKFK